MTQKNGSFFDRAMSNLRDAWLEIAQTVGLAEGDGAAAQAADLRARIRECVEARGGEVSARARAANIGRLYLGLDGEGRRRFLQVLAEDFAADPDALYAEIKGYDPSLPAADRLALEDRLRAALAAPRVALLRQFNALPEGTKFVVDLRADLLREIRGDPHLAALDRDIEALLADWFDVGFLELRAISWNSPAALLEKLIAYESVHEIRSWSDLRNRLSGDRRCYAFFHPRMPEEPLIFVEVALVQGLSGSIQALLDEGAPEQDPRKADTAIFYSISNTQVGLRGISFGNFLIKRVVDQLAAEFPQLRHFSTLSPIPGFRAWLDRRLAEAPEDLLAAEDRAAIAALGQGEGVEGLKAVLARQDWLDDAAAAAALERPLTRLCASYLLEKRPDGRASDAVARFHLGNGARIERLNWRGDLSPKGVKQAAGLMVNYLYDRAEIEENHEAYARDGAIAVSAAVQALVDSRAARTRVRGRRLGGLLKAG